MNELIYILLSVLVIWVVISLLPVLLPFVLLVIVAIFIIGLYIRHKINKQMDEFNNELHEFEEQDPFDDFTFFEKSNDDSVNDVIDVEYTETETDDQDD